MAMHEANPVSLHAVPNSPELVLLNQFLSLLSSLVHTRSLGGLVPLACSSVNYDNYITVAMAQHPVLHARTKDMEVDLFFVRERNFCLLYHKLKVVSPVSKKTHPDLEDWQSS
ncbi:hypothetical protein KIW84_054883 [Lathyrus oleraceus]|uniref:Uncharacterized protein n=1 Tax=Pisum sativum TaxID=3888 RepID=A0A9D4WX83_PEA|nr:hypothetical protein KIW84_054883 [Pisum sativum]